MRLPVPGQKEIDRQGAALLRGRITMTSKELATQTTSEIIESVVIGGDLARLTPEQRVSYYHAVCKSLGINPLTRPFDYLSLNGKLTLYAKKDATDQLRKLHEVSIDDVDIRETDTQFVVKVKGHDKTGRSDVEVGVVNKSDMRGDAANAQMKAVTKGKRRLTLSLVGLGWLDETEVETIPDARPVVVAETGEIVNRPEPWTEEEQPRFIPHKATPTEFWSTVKKAGLSKDEGKRALEECGGDFDKALGAVEQLIPPASERE
jgi:hypothetical protein